MSFRTTPPPPHGTPPPPPPARPPPPPPARTAPAPHHPDAAPPPAAPGSERQLIAGAKRNRAPHRRLRAVDPGIQVGPRDRHRAWPLGDEMRPHERALERCGAVVVAEQQVGGGVREPVH